MLLRPAIGIGGDGDPAMRQLARLARLGLGGPVGNGEQWVSWIGIHDFLDLLVRSVTTIAAWLLGSDPALALTGRRCVPTRLLGEGHVFRETDIDRVVSKAVDQAT